MAIIFVGTKNPSKLWSVQAGYREYYPNDLYTVAVFSSTTTTTSATPILGDLLRVLTPPPTLPSAEPSPTGPLTGTQQHHIIIGIEVESGVASQPFSAEETLLGGRNRAKAIRAVIDATPDDALHDRISPLILGLGQNGDSSTTDPIQLSNRKKFFFVGIEGGVEKVCDKWLESGYIIVQNYRGVECVGTSARFELAQFVIDELNTGKELCEVVDRLSGLDDVRSTQGYMGIITNTLLNRSRAYNHGVLFAFSKFEGPETYWDEKDREPQQ